MGRWPSISTLSSASATTDGELSDDSVSVDADSEPFPAGAAKATATASATAAVKMEAPSTPTKAADAAAASVDSTAKRVAAAEPAGVSCPPPAAKSGIDQEMGELSELFAPDAFLQSTVLDTEMEAAGSSAARAAASAMDIAIEPTATESARPAHSIAAGALSAAAPDGAKAAAFAAALPAVVKAEYLPASPLPAVVSLPSPPAPATTAAGSSAASPTASATASATTVAEPAAPNQECRCGEAACPSLARKRPLLDLSSTSSSSAAGGSRTSGGAPLSLMTGVPYAGLSSRQRKRQRSLAPVLSAPRTVSYECSLCKESYPSEISSNPWWSLFLHECPRCHRMQIPRVDAASAAVSVDYIHAVCAEEGEGCDSDG